jgi:hypothetical protein
MNYFKPILNLFVLLFLCNPTLDAQTSKLTKYLGNAINNEFFNSFPDTPVIACIEVTQGGISIIDLGASFGNHTQSRIISATEKFLATWVGGGDGKYFKIPLIMAKVNFVGAQPIAAINLKSIEGIFAYSIKSRSDLEEPVVILYDKGSKPKE